MEISKNQKIVFVAGIHGDEQAPVRALRENEIEFLLGNPRAYERGIRFTESDLNASFGVGGESYESRRASEILQEIGENSLVVDFHSTSAATPPFAIVVNGDMIPFAATAGLDRVVVMSYNIKEGHALINFRKGMSVEVGNHDTKESYDTTLQVAKKVQAGIPGAASVYEVYDKITEPGVYVNFQPHPNGFIPILAGEQAYDFYGLKAREIK